MNGKEAMQEEFFHTFNALLDKGSQVIISADRAPNKLFKNPRQNLNQDLLEALLLIYKNQTMNLEVKLLNKNRGTKHFFIQIK